MKTPLFDQYKRLKDKYPDAVILLSVNDFYETFADDAITVSKVLGTVLIKRDSIPVTGFASYSLELNLHKLVRAGNRVAVVNELLTPNKPKNETRNTLSPTKKI